jgi:hypothetical protein
MMVSAYPQTSQVVFPSDDVPKVGAIEVGRFSVVQWSLRRLPERAGGSPRSRLVRLGLSSSFGGFDMPHCVGRLNGPC